MTGLAVIFCGNAESVGAMVTGQAASGPCPACGAAMQTERGYPAWCDACDWNLLPQGAAARTGRQRRRTERAARHEDAILARALRERGLPVRHDLQSRLAVAIAVTVHLLTVAVIALGVWSCFLAARYPPLAALALACFAMGYALRPRLGRLPRDYVLSRQSHPLLFGLLDSISAAAGAPRFDRMVLARGPDAATGRVGLRRRRVLLAGAALWSVLEWDERIAVLAHEAGHNVSNDSRRGFFLGSSLAALAVWINVLTPRSGVVHNAQLLVRAFIRLPLRWLAALLYAAQLRLSSGVSRLAEYRADWIAASAAGPDAAARALDTMLVTGDCMKHLGQTILYRPDAPLWAAQKAFAANYPERQRLRLRRLDQQSVSSVYASHPTVSRRIAYLSAVPAAPVTALATAGQLADIDRELEPLLSRMAAEIRSEVYSKLTPAQLETLPQRPAASR